MIYEPNVEQTELDLSPSESGWLEHRRVEAERALQEEQPSRRLPARMRKACDRWSVEAGWVAAGLEGATVTKLPDRETARAGRGGSSVSDPTSAALGAVLGSLERAAARWAHLTGPCPLDGTRSHVACCGDTVMHGCAGFRHDCPPGAASTLGEWLGLDLAPAVIVDGLLGTPVSSTGEFAAIVSRAALWHSTAAATLSGAWADAYRAGAEPSKLQTITTETEDLARRMATLAGYLADWSGRSEPRCADGCGGAKPQRAATCDRCRQRTSRARRQAG